MHLDSRLSLHSFECIGENEDLLLDTPTNPRQRQNLRNENYLNIWACVKQKV